MVKGCFMILRGNFSSDALRSSTNIQLLIPDHLDGPYRVVYLLHGLHGDQGTWLDNSMLPVYAKQYNAVFVLPEVGRSFFLNLQNGRRYFDYVSDELPALCRRLFNISSKREDTAAMGCSMGGYGSLRLGLLRPDIFGFCGAISSACLYFKPMLDGLRKDPGPYLASGQEAREVYADIKCAFGEAIEYRRECDVSELIKDFPAGKSKPKIFITCGTEDSLRKENLIFRDQIKTLGFDFSYEEWSGNHEWYFFNEALRRTLEVWYS